MSRYPRRWFEHLIPGLRSRSRFAAALVCVAAVSAYVDGGGGATAWAAGSSGATFTQTSPEPTGGIALSGASATLVQTGDTAWTLAKTGLVDAASGTVSWTITATEGQTVAGHLVFSGQMTVTNSGTGPATIGNIVVNLQKRVSNTWVSASADVADATNGDAATTAKIFKQASSEGKSTFTENSASGSLEFMDATNNTVFSLVPEVTIPGGGTKSLLFQATFDNNVLNLAPGTQIRSETIISFGNATTSNASAPNIDINGNGVIDSDEARVRSVPSRLTLTVPSQTNGAANPTLSDAASDITATGTVSFSNVVINLGATSGTVTATVDGGTDGGRITNCAHLTDPGIQVTSGGFTFWQVEPMDLEKCDTEDVGGTGTCTPGAPGCGWETDNMHTFTQTQWGDPASSGASLLSSAFATVYPAGSVEVGIAGTAGFSIAFTFVDTIIAYLPAPGAAGQLTGDLLNPTSTAAGAYGGEVLALQLNIDFSRANLLAGVEHLGDLRICNFAALPQLNGQTVSQFAATANTILGGGTGSVNVDEANAVATLINGAFLSGSPSSFAQTSLVAGNCP